MDNIEILVLNKNPNLCSEHEAVDELINLHLVSNYKGKEIRKRITAFKREAMEELVALDSMVGDFDPNPSQRSQWIVPLNPENEAVFQNYAKRFRSDRRSQFLSFVFSKKNAMDTFRREEGSLHTAEILSSVHEYLEARVLQPKFAMVRKTMTLEELEQALVKRLFLSANQAEVRIQQARVYCIDNWVKAYPKLQGSRLLQGARAIAQFFQDNEESINFANLNRVLLRMDINDPVKTIVQFCHYIGQEAESRRGKQIVRYLDYVKTMKLLIIDGPLKVQRPSAMLRFEAVSEDLRRSSVWF